MLVVPAQAEVLLNGEAGQSSSAFDLMASRLSP
jgi:hypothetical protein